MMKTIITCMRGGANQKGSEPRDALPEARTPHRLYAAPPAPKGAGGGRWHGTLLFRARRAIPLSNFRERSRCVLAPDNLSSVRVGRGVARAEG